MRDLSDEQKKVYEQTLIERGLLLPRKPPGRQVEQDPFKEVAAELFKNELEEIVRDGKADISDALKKNAKRKTARKAGPRKTKKRKRN